MSRLQRLLVLRHLLLLQELRPSSVPLPCLRCTRSRLHQLLNLINSCALCSPRPICARPPIRSKRLLNHEIELRPSSRAHAPPGLLHESSSANPTRRLIDLKLSLRSEQRGQHCHPSLPLRVPRPLLLLLLVPRASPASPDVSALPSSPPSSSLFLLLCVSPLCDCVVAQESVPSSSSSHRERQRHRERARSKNATRSTPSDSPLRGRIKNCNTRRLGHRATRRRRARPQMNALCQSSWGKTCNGEFASIGSRLLVHSAAAASPAAAAAAAAERQGTLRFNRTKPWPPSFLPSFFRERSPVLYPPPPPALAPAPTPSSKYRLAQRK